jgi:hypothetical protein
MKNTPHTRRQDEIVIMKNGSEYDGRVYCVKESSLAYDSMAL